MKRWRDVLKLFLFLIIGTVVLSACQNGGADPNAGSQTETPAGSGQSEENNMSSTETGSMTLPQLMPLQSGEELAVLHTSMGDVKLRFFPEQAPIAVENFLTHAKNGYYDGVIFHRVIEDFMIQGGDPEGTGMGGESIWGGGFDVEFSFELRHFRGALAMAHSSEPSSNGSQFYIVQNHNLSESFATLFKDLRNRQDELVTETENGNIYVRDIYPTAVLDTYLNNGGTPHLDRVYTEKGHTVFGHVMEGMDVVDAIAAVPVVDPSKQNHKPVTDVIIESITFEIVP